jgi:hypothetical protein
MNHTDFTIHPFEGVGAVRFGMTPQQVHEVWGEPDDTYREETSPYGLAKSHVDYYRKIGVHIDYDETGFCECISLFSHINDDSKWNTGVVDEDEDELPEDAFEYSDSDDGLDIFIDDKLSRRTDYEQSSTLIETDEEGFRHNIISPTFQGRELYGQTMGEFKDWFKGLDTAIQHCDGGFIFLKYGVGIYSQYYYVPDKDPDCLVEMVIVASAEYTDVWVEGYLTDGHLREELPFSS